MPGVPQRNDGLSPPSAQRRCVCPRCGYTAERSPAVPCWSMRCPNCETPLVEVP